MTEARGSGFREGRELRYGSSPRFREALGQIRHPPLRDRRFWLIQGLILAIVAGHLSLDLHVAGRIGAVPDYPTVGLFLLPVIYSALRFGLGGAAASAGWGTLLMVPDLIVVDSRADLWADGTLLALTLVVAVTVGLRVEREAMARRSAVEALRAHTAAEARFRALFEAGSSPTLVVDADGGLREANPAARALFGDRLGRRRLSDLVGDGVASQLLSQSPPRELRITGPGAPGRVLRPLSTLLTDRGGDPLLQIILQDVTEEAERQHLTETYARQALMVQEEERLRIGRDIHDEPLQTLIYLARRLEALSELNGLDEEGRKSLEGIRVGLLGVMAQLRQLADGLRPPALDDLGLTASLRQLAASFADRTTAQVSIRFRGTEPRLEWGRKTDLFRIVQEALRNAERHASATRVAVEVAYSARTVKVKVRDDGCGFQVTEEKIGMGLRGMRERASLSSGSLLLESAPERGTTVVLTMPVEPQQRTAGPDTATVELGPDGPLAVGEGGRSRPGAISNGSPGGDGLCVRPGQGPARSRGPAPGTPILPR